MVEHLPSKQKALSSVPSTEKTNKRTAAFLHIINEFVKKEIGKKPFIIASKNYPGINVTKEVKDFYN